MSYLKNYTVNFNILRFSAYYCSYFVVDLSTKRVLGFWVATKQMVQKSTHSIMIFSDLFAGKLLSNDGTTGCQGGAARFGACKIGFEYFHLITVNPIGT